MKTKPFDCVEMQHLGGAALDRRLRGMSVEEQMKFWPKRNAAMRRRVQSARKMVPQKTG